MYTLIKIEMWNQPQNYMNNNVLLRENTEQVHRGQINNLIMSIHHFQTKD